MCPSSCFVYPFPWESLHCNALPCILPFFGISLGAQTLTPASDPWPVKRDRFNWRFHTAATNRAEQGQKWWLFGAALSLSLCWAGNRHKAVTSHLLKTGQTSELWFTLLGISQVVVQGTQEFSGKAGGYSAARTLWCLEPSGPLQPCERSPGPCIAILRLPATATPGYSWEAVWVPGLEASEL